MSLPLISAPSPNFGPRPAGCPIDMLVIHYTGMDSGPAALARLRDPAAEVSSHYLIEEDGRIFQLVAEEMRAWHAGRSYWRGETDINSRSIGIELVNPGHEFGYRPFSATQIAALLALSRQILARHPIPACNVVGHSDVAPARKQDPGELFPWQALAEQGLGLWPQSLSSEMMTEAEARTHLAAFGYDPTLSLEDLLQAFHRHFRPQAVTGELDGESCALSRGLG